MSVHLEVKIRGWLFWFHWYLCLCRFVCNRLFSSFGSVDLSCSPGFPSFSSRSPASHCSSGSPGSLSSLVILKLKVVACHVRTKHVRMSLLMQELGWKWICLSVIGHSGRKHNAALVASTVDLFPFTWTTSGYYSHNYAALPLGASFISANKPLHQWRVHRWTRASWEWN